MLIELETFRLASGTDEAAFVAADGAAQTAFYYAQPGIVRRTTARGDDGEWLVVTMWTSAAEADAARGRSLDDEAITALNALLDPATVRTTRYSTLD